MKKRKSFRHRILVSPTYMVFMWFGSFVLAGTVMLWLPPARVSPELHVDFSSALFTAVSAACVTGLTVVNVAETFSFAGQLVIFLLMLMGGMGIMTFATLGFRLIGRRLSIQQQIAVADAIYQNDAASEFRRTFLQILGVTAWVQLGGAVGMALALVPRHWDTDPLFMIWSALFHSASAFCNSGFTLYPDGLASLGSNHFFLVILLVLITLGGLGHTVLNELFHLPRLFRRRVKKPHWLSLNTKVVLVVTGLLIVFGIAAIWALGTSGAENSLWGAVFETVSGRTAGFSLVPQSGLPLPAVIVMLFLMFVGGSPGSCAGGIKTTSLAIWIGRLQANLRNDANVNLFGYTIAPELVSRARILIAVNMIWNVLGVFILSVEHPGESLQTLIFEQISAFGTVGLSMEFTAKLTAVSRVWIIVSMFIGRLGPLSIAFWVVPASKVKINRPIGRVMVG